MPVRGPFKKDLTPIGRGGIDKFNGKGAREQSGFGGSMTGGDPFARTANRYPKPSLGDLAPPAAPMPGLPMGGGEPDGDEAV